MKRSPNYNCYYKWAIPVVSTAAVFFMTTTCVIYMVVLDATPKDNRELIMGSILAATTGNDAIIIPPVMMKQGKKGIGHWNAFNMKANNNDNNNNNNLDNFDQNRESLLEHYETKYPPDDLQRIKAYVDKYLRHTKRYKTQADMEYDIYNCPANPPIGYPRDWPALHVVTNWNPGNTTEPERLFQGLCVFDYSDDLDVERATKYRNAEVPFLVSNVPDVMRAAERWHRYPNYLELLIGDEELKTEHSVNQHFMYWKRRSHLPPGWLPPTDETKLTYNDWLHKAQTLRNDQVKHERWYFRLNAEYKGSHHYLYEELPLFVPRNNNFFMVNPKEQRGMNCRFGMKGVIAETHFDSSRNFIALMGGQRRYILNHPKYCKNMQLYPQSHPSGRHTAVDWTNIDVKQFPTFAQGRINEVVLQAGDVLYLPTHWMHTIVSLNINYQCNARSGTTTEYEREIVECGFASR